MAFLREAKPAQGCKSCKNSEFSVHTTNSGVGVKGTEIPEFLTDAFLGDI